MKDNSEVWGLQAWLDPGVSRWSLNQSLSLFLKNSFFAPLSSWLLQFLYGGEKVATAAAVYLVLTGNLTSEGEGLTFFQCSYQSPEGHDCPSLDWFSVWKNTLWIVSQGTVPSAGLVLLLLLFRDVGRCSPEACKSADSFEGTSVLLLVIGLFKISYYLSQL